MITTEIAFNEAFNLEKVLLLVDNAYPKYTLRFDEQQDFNNLSHHIEYNSNVYKIFEIVFTKQKHIEHLISLLHTQDKSTVTFSDIEEEFKNYIIETGKSMNEMIKEKGYVIIKT